MRNLSVTRSAKILLALAVALLGPGLIAAKADAISTQNFSGTFQNGGTFTGSVTVDTPSGDNTPGTGQYITGGSVTVYGEGANDMTYTNPLDDGIEGSEVVYYFQAGTGYAATYIDLYFMESSSISGNSICTTANDSGPSCGSGDYFSQLRPYDGPGNSSLYENVTSAVATPESSSLSMLALGLVGLGLLFAKRREVLS
jgi:MYXO-CTERM domain-containing protein